MEQLISFLTKLATDVAELKQWKSEQDERIKAEVESAEASKRGFNEFIEARIAAETKQAADAAELAKMMV